MFEPIQNQAAGHDSSSGPICWYPGPETWNYGEHDVLDTGLTPSFGDDFLFA